MNRTLRLILLPLTLALAACTPEQITAWEQEIGAPFDAPTRAWLADLDDAPIQLDDGRQIEIDGTITAPPTLAEAVALAQFGVCDSWRPVYDAAVRKMTRQPPTWAWFRKTLWRESGCGVDIYNEGTGDSGPLQINPVHRGWVKAELGYDFAELSRSWLPGVEAFVRLWDKTGPCNWRPPDFCKRG